MTGNLREDARPVPPCQVRLVRCPRARFDRPLNERERRAVQSRGRHIRNGRWRFDRIIASPAVRVAETIETASRAWGSAFPVEWDRRIYLASSATLIDLLREMDGDPESVLMVGHNPGLEDLIFDLVPDDGSSPCARSSSGNSRQLPLPSWSWPSTAGKTLTWMRAARRTHAPARPRRDARARTSRLNRRRHYGAMPVVGFRTTHQERRISPLK
jgi:phosphohistidine phosphatase SixA